MVPYKVFIVGHEGTTGLRIHERLTDRKDIELLATADENRKNVEAIKEVAKETDIVFLCLPDVASKEIMAAIGELPCKVIDTSTAFRTADDWAYVSQNLVLIIKQLLVQKNILLIQDVMRAA